ncbi:L,D-transpeptidase [Labrys sp. LIt4]|uniref:L,D-transpeptidase n=1 Tax=Labrys sp. LIt4 TaxID=2821355 RepID=UPI001ADFCEAD|nr:L,D-transpeptidase [Labrys sp. LIt4]MBP0579403.1 L,D-transpeptidase [Labrys sp. LIt4]
MFPADFAVSTVSYPSQEKPGTIVVNVNERKLYLIEGQGRARRYAIAVGRAGYRWNGVAQLERKSAWPSWYPTDDMAKEAPGIPRMIPGGRANPLGARALYLYANGRDTLYRIHGTSEPWTIGTQASSGCIRMFNEDVIDLFERVSVGAKVIVS